MSTRETMKQLAKQEALKASDNTPAAPEQTHLQFWEEKSTEIRQELANVIQRELQIEFKKIKLIIASDLNQVTEEIRQENLEELAVLLEEPVLKMGEVISTLEAVGARSNQKLVSLESNLEQTWKVYALQQNLKSSFEMLIEKAGREVKELQGAAHESKEILIEILIHRWRRVILIACILIAVPVALSEYMNLRFYQPNQLTIEESQFWRLYTSEMTATQKTDLIKQLQSRQRKREEEIEAQEKNQK